MTRDKIEERYGWQPCEREAMQRDLAERQRRDGHDEAVAWAKAWVQEKAEAERLPIEKQTAAKPEMPMTTGPQTWEAWVDIRIRASRQASEKAMLGGVADAIAEVIKVERGARQKAETETAVLKLELAALKSEVAELRALKTEVAELRGELRVRSAIDGVEDRLGELEGPLARLKEAS
jgi:hypothetical protein